jgi:hypothetical protein
MKTKFLFFIGFYLLLGLTVLKAQDKLFKTNDLLNRELYPETMSNLTWMGDSEAFTFIKNNALIQKSAFDPTKTDTLLKIADLNSQLKNIQEEELNRFPGITWLDQQRFYFVNSNAVYLFNRADSVLKKENEWDEK